MTSESNKMTKKMYPQYLIIPAAILYTVMFLVPNISSFYYAFTNWNALSNSFKYIGLDNFRDIFSDSSGNINVFKNTAIFALYTTGLKLVIGFVLAVLLNDGIRSRTALRAVFYLPITLSTVLLGIMFSEIYSPSGILNGILESIGLSQWTHSWIAEPKMSIWAISSVEVWRASGFAMAVFLAAMQMIPKEIYEAAEMDGTTWFQKLTRIVIPYLYQAIVINVTLSIIAGLKVFDLIFIITNGGPARSSEVVNVTVLNEFSKGNYGLSTAMGVLLFVIVTVAYFIINGIFKKFEVDVT